MAKTPKKTIKDFNKTEILHENSPFAFAESIKSLRTNINFITYSGEVKTILITSSIPDEGKTTVSINLAVSLAQAGKKVLIVDADLRNPSIHRYLRLRRADGGGFSTYLSGQCTLADAVYHVPTYGIDLMLAGPIPPNAAELLSRDSLRTMFIDLKEKYDIIIVDTPPIGVVTDAAIIAQHVDGAIMNVRHRFAEKDQIISSTRKLQASGVKIIGSVLNDFEVSRSTADYNYQYAYGYGDNHD